MDYAETGRGKGEGGATMNEAVSGDTKNGEEEAIHQKIPRAFRIFLELEKEARGEKPHKPRFLSSNSQSNHQNGGDS